MSDDLPPEPEVRPVPTPAPPPVPDPATEAAATDAAATRRRWVTLGEFVAVAGLLIAVVGLWLTWSDRHSDLADRQAQKAAEIRSHTRLLVTADAEQDGERLVLSDATHDVQSIAVRFPAWLGVKPQTNELEPRLPTSWVSAALLAATDRGPDRRRGKLPILLTVYWAEAGDVDTPRSDTAIYDLVWETEGRVLRGRKVRLRGMLLRERSSNPARLEAIAAAEKPK